MSPGRILREARKRHEVTQAELAIRAGTTQSAISRIEQDRVSPSIETLRELLYLLGEDLVLSVEPRDSGVDATLNWGSLQYTPDQRLDRTLQFASLVNELRGRNAPPDDLGGA